MFVGEGVHTGSTATDGGSRVGPVLEWISKNFLGFQSYMCKFMHFYYSVCFFSYYIGCLQFSRLYELTHF